LIEVGVDLVELKTLIFVEVLHSLYPMQQASRRHWRLHQTTPCRTYYLYYRNTLEERAVQQLGRKKLAANLLYGDLPEDEGLEALSGEEGLGSLLRELALSLDEADETPVADLTDLFQQTTRPPTAQDSVWLNGIAETVQIAVPAPFTITPSPSLVLPIPAAALSIPPPPARNIHLPTTPAAIPTALSAKLATLNLLTVKLARVQARVLLALEQGIPHPTDSALKLCEGVGQPDFAKYPVHAEVLIRWLAKYLRVEKALSADAAPAFAAELVALAQPIVPTALTIAPTPAHDVQLPTVATATPPALGAKLDTLKLPPDKLAKVQARVMLALEQGISNPLDSTLKLCEGVGQPDFAKYSVHAEVLTRWLVKYLRSEKALSADAAPTFAAELVALARLTVTTAPLTRIPPKVVPKPKQSKPDLLAIPDDTPVKPAAKRAAQSRAKTPRKPTSGSQPALQPTPQQRPLFDLTPAVLSG
jgi:hypothetical protein